MLSKCHRSEVRSTKGGRSRLSCLDALFHSSHPGSEFRVLVLRLSVPNRVWDFMGSPLLIYLASNIYSGGPSWFYHLQNVCVRVSTSQVFKQLGPAET